MYQPVNYLPHIPDAVLLRSQRQYRCVLELARQDSSTPPEDIIVEVTKQLEMIEGEMQKRGITTPSNVGDGTA